MHARSPLVLVLLLAGGDLLLVWEANRPGMVLPGAAGILLVLLAAAGVIGNGGSWLNLLPLLLAILFFVLDTRRPRRFFAALTFASLLWFLLMVAHPARSPLTKAVATATALLLALVHAWMARIARRARLNKGLD